MMEVLEVRLHPTLGSGVWYLTKDTTPGSFSVLLETPSVENQIAATPIESWITPVYTFLLRTTIDELLEITRRFRACDFTYTVNSVVIFKGVLDRLRWSKQGYILEISTAALQAFRLLKTSDLQQTGLAQTVLPVYFGNWPTAGIKCIALGNNTFAIAEGGSDVTSLLTNLPTTPTYRVTVISVKGRDVSVVVFNSYVSPEAVVTVFGKSLLPATTSGILSWVCELHALSYKTCTINTYASLSILSETTVKAVLDLLAARSWAIVRVTDYIELIEYNTWAGKAIRFEQEGAEYSEPVTTLTVTYGANALTLQDDSAVAYWGNTYPQSVTFAEGTFADMYAWGVAFLTAFSGRVRRISGRLFGPTPPALGYWELPEYTGWLYGYRVDAMSEYVCTLRVTDVPWVPSFRVLQTSVGTVVLDLHRVTSKVVQVTRTGLQQPLTATIEVNGVTYVADSLGNVHLPLPAGTYTMYVRPAEGQGSPFSQEITL